MDKYMSVEILIIVMYLVFKIGNIIGHAIEKRMNNRRIEMLKEN